MASPSAVTLTAYKLTSPVSQKTHQVKHPLDIPLELLFEFNLRIEVSCFVLGFVFGVTILSLNVIVKML